MKKYYNRLTKEEQNAIKKGIKNDKEWDIYKRIYIYSYLTYGCLIFIIFDIYFNYYTNGAKYNYIIDGLIIISLVLFYYKLVKIRRAITILNNIFMYKVSVRNDVIFHS